MNNDNNTSLDFNEISKHCNEITYIAIVQFVVNILFKFAYLPNGKKYSATKLLSYLKTITEFESGGKDFLIPLVTIGVVVVPILMIILSLVIKDNNKLLGKISIGTSIYRILCVFTLGSGFSYYGELKLGFHISIILSIVALIYGIKYLKKLDNPENIS